MNAQKKNGKISFLQRMKVFILLVTVFATQFSVFAAPIENQNASTTENSTASLTTTETVTWNQTDWSGGRGTSIINQFSDQKGLIWDVPGQLTIDFSYNQNLEGTGDVNQSGTVTVVDGQTVLNFIDGRTNLTINEQQIGDVDNDNRHTAVDVQAIADRATGVLSELPIMIGDVNRNGVITSTDAQMALQMAVGSFVGDDYQEFVADVNFDQKITALDAQIILNRATGNVKCLPYLNGQDSDLCTKEPRFTGYGTLTSNVFDGGAEIKWNKLGIIAGFIANGDINQDGVVLATDALFALKHWAGEITLTPEQQLIGDVDQDGIVTKADSIMILRKAVGSLSTLPITFGDLNGDDKVTTADVLIAQKHVSGESALTGDRLFLADVNVDEQVNATDVDLIMKRAVGTQKCLPVVEGVSSTECGELGGLKNTPGVKVYARVANTKTALNDKEFVLVTPGNLSNLVGRYLQYKVELKGQEHLILKEVQFTGTKEITTPDNNPPVWEGPSSVRQFVGTEMKFTVTAEDPDGDPLKITYDIPSGATYNVSTGEFKWSSSVEKTATARFFASDGKATTTKTIQLEFYGTLPENKPPVITLIGNDQIEVLKGSNFVDPGATAFDPEDGNITDKITKKILFNGTEVSRIDTSKTGTYTIIYTVIDSGGKSDTESRIVLVKEDPNRAPVIEGPVLAKSQVGDPIRFTLNIYDPDGDPITLTHIIPDGATFNKQTGEFYWLSNVPAEFLAVFVASDGKLSTTHKVAIGVFPRPNQKPVITLLGSSTISIPKGQNFTDPGATAFDPEDGDITHRITKTITFNGVATSTVNTNVVGEYRITYRVSDSQGLAADPVTRKVIVFSVAQNNPPTITLVGSSTIDIIKGQNFTDPGATAFDPEDGDITHRIVRTISFNGSATSTINTNVVGTYTITYRVTDSEGLTASTNRIVRVVNPPANNPPVLQGPNAATTTVGIELKFTIIPSDPDNDPVTVTSVLPSGATYSTTTHQFAWTPTVPGTTTATFFATDGKATTTKTVHITILATTTPTNTAPIITLNGSSTVQINKGQNFTDPGATAFDAEEGDLTDRIIKTITFNGSTTQSIDTNRVGEYRITYSVTDSGGLSDTETRILTIVDIGNPGNNPPVIQGPNEATTTVGVEMRFTVTASDPDNDPVKVTYQIPTGATYSTTTGQFSWTPTATGTATATFFATDGKATTTKNVLLTVLGTTTATNTPPTITLIGSNPIEINKGQNFTDPGATATDREDGDLTNRIVRRIQFEGQTVDNVNTNNIGDYIITYSVTDNGGLTATTSRTVRVKETPNTGGPGCGSCGGGGVPTLPDPLRITNVRVLQVVPGTALVTWNTNLPATSRVVYDTNSVPTAILSVPNLGYRFSSATFTSLTTAHQVTIFNLPVGQTHYFRPVSTTTNETAIGNEVFLTPGGVVTPTPGPTPTNPITPPTNPGGPIIIIDRDNSTPTNPGTSTVSTTTGIVKIKKTPTNLAAALFGIPFVLDEILKCLYLLILVLALTYIITVLLLEIKKFRAWVERNTPTPEMSLWSFLLSLVLIASFFFEILRCIQVPLAIILLILAIYLAYQDSKAKNDPKKPIAPKADTKGDIKSVTKTETKTETTKEEKIPTIEA